MGTAGHYHPGLGDLPRYSVASFAFLAQQHQAATNLPSAK